MKLSVRLTFLSGSNDGNIINLEPEDNQAVITLGRLEDCTIRIPDDPEISRKHAHLFWNGSTGCWMLEDLNSTNGTYIGEFKQASRISNAVALTFGDIFRVGHTCFRLEAPQDNKEESSSVAYAKMSN